MNTQNMKSAIYSGQVRHRRVQPTGHEFVYRLFMMYLDLSELDTVFRGRWFWSTRKSALARFSRENHLGDAGLPLDQAVRDLVELETGRRPCGPVRLLTNLSYFGYCFNPVSFYYCFDADDQQVETIVAEVNNTPWGERHCYVLSESMNSGVSQHKRYSPAKKMHVSQFMPMDIDYDWRFSTPNGQLAVHMENAREGRKLFDATLEFKRTEISAGSLARVLMVYPFITLKIITAIHWQALRLWLKRVPVYDHPDKNVTT
ncbi:MAG: DUF1365 domain-containing protein [Lysobacterales bacterium]